MYIDPTGLSPTIFAGAVAGGLISISVDFMIQYYSAISNGQEFSWDILQAISAFTGGALAGAMTSGASIGASLLHGSGQIAAMTVASGISGSVGSGTSTLMNNAFDGNDLGSNLSLNMLGGAIGSTFTGGSLNTFKVFKTNGIGLLPIGAPTSFTPRTITSMAVGLGQNFSVGLFESFISSIATQLIDEGSGLANYNNSSSIWDSGEYDRLDYDMENPYGPS